MHCATPMYNNKSTLTRFDRITQRNRPRVRHPHGRRHRGMQRCPLPRAQERRGRRHAASPIRQAAPRLAPRCSHLTLPTLAVPARLDRRPPDPWAAAKAMSSLVWELGSSRLLVRGVVQDANKRARHASPPAAPPPLDRRSSLSRPPRPGQVFTGSGRMTT